MNTKIQGTYTNEEIKLFRKLNTPQKVQGFLDMLKINFEEQGDTCMSPRSVLEAGKAHCMEAAMLAAAILEFHGHKPLLMDLRADKHDYDHVVTLFKVGKCWGAISKTNHATLRYREPIYQNLRELAISYFHEYFNNDNGIKSLRDYSIPMDLRRFDNLSWRTSKEDLFDIAYELDCVRHFPLYNKKLAKHFRKADPMEIKAGRLTEY
jgi:hypothetical protein